MDVLSHTFLPLIFLIAIGKLKARYIPFAFFSVFPDFDKLILPGIFHSIIFAAPLLSILFYAERMLFRGYELASISAFFYFSHLAFVFLDEGPLALLYPISNFGIGISFSAKIFVSNMTVEDLVPEMIYEELKPSESYELFSGFGFASMLLFFLILVNRKSLLGEFRFKKMGNEGLDNNSN